MPGREREAFMPRELVERVLASAPPDVVLIGGQALAYWMAFYDIHAPESTVPAISRDVDYFTPDPANSAPLKAFARAIGGRAEVRDIRALSALIGSAVAPAGDGRLYIVDLVHDVVGLDRDHVGANSVPVSVPGTDITLRVMHPVDVLQSRNANLHSLAEEQDDAGQLQLRLAIEVVRAFLEERMASAQWDDIADFVHSLGQYAKEDAARKNAERYAIHLADAIPAWLIDLDVFWEKQWPHLRERMSPEHAQKCEELRRSRS